MLTVLHMKFSHKGEIGEIVGVGAERENDTNNSERRWNQIVKCH